MNTLAYRLCLLCIPIGLTAQSQPFWIDKPESEIQTSGVRTIVPDVYKTYTLDTERLQLLLNATPAESDLHVRNSDALLTVPDPDGGMVTFRIVLYEMLEPALSARYPQIRTIYGVAADGTARRIRGDWTLRGFHAKVATPQGDFFIDPYARDHVTDYVVYHKRNYPRPDFECHVDENDPAYKEADNVPTQRMPGDCSLRRYRLAMATTGEYSNYHGAFDVSQEGLVLSEVTTSINRVNDVYEQDITVRLMLIAATTDVFYYDGTTDPYTNNNVSQMLGQNQETMGSVIGSPNYDIGHVYGTGPGGVAGLSVVCNSSNNSKARGVTGLSNPVGDPFYIDYVAHEIGHQFGGSHTFNGTAGSCSNGRSASSAYEPGSGSTIMAYAGICGSQNLQQNSDAYFHARSIIQMSNFVTGNGNSCATFLSFDNEAPTVDAGPNKSIPVLTPFMLTATASDPDNDPILYCWEQYDLEQPPSEPPVSNDPDGPMYRSFLPNDSPTRYFPRLTDIVNNNSPAWEVLSSVGRTLTFKATVRDVVGGIGCTDDDNVVLTTVASAGPFVVTAPNTAVTWTHGDTETVTWNVANTTASPVSCANVDIYISYDGGFTYPDVLASNVPNNGSASVTVPDVFTDLARVMVKCANNVFFDISNVNFTLTAPFTCRTYLSEISTVNIPDFPGGPLVIKLNIADDGLVHDVNVINLHGTHTRMADLDVFLSNPQGTSAELFTDICGSNANFNLGLDDEASTTIPCPPTTGLLHRPEGNLSVLDGVMMKGNWLLSITDDQAGQTGTLQGWGLEICVTNFKCEPLVKNTNDDGPGSLRDVLSCAEEGDTVRFDATLAGGVIQLNSPLVFEKDLVILVTTQDNISISGNGISRALEVPVGITVELHGLRILAGNSTNGGAILNAGDLLVRDVLIGPTGLLPENMVFNSGVLTIEGVCNFGHE